MDYSGNAASNEYCSKDSNKINADENAIAAAMENIDAEYEALVANHSLVTV